MSFIGKGPLFFLYPAILPCVTVSLQVFPELTLFQSGLLLLKEQSQLGQVYGCNYMKSPNMVP